MKEFFKAHKKLVSLLLCLGLAIGTVSAAVFTIFYVNTTATVKNPDVRLIAGSDSGGTTYPGANVSVTTTYDFANVSLSLFRSEESSPQPFTYYTNLTLIKNNGAAAHSINKITITSLSGVLNIGNVTVYYYTSQTDTPDKATATGYASLYNTSSAPITVFSGSQSIAASGTHYIEIIGCADEEASVDSTITFAIAIQWA